MTKQTISGGGRRNSSGLARDIEILEVLGVGKAAEGLGVSQVAQAIGRDKAVVSRALSTLAEAGLVERDETTLRYYLGPQVYALASRTAVSALARKSRTFLRALTQATRETSHLCVLRGGNVHTLLSELSPHEFRTTGWAGVTTAAWRTPSGRALLSDWDLDSLAKWYENHGQDQALVDTTTQDIDVTDFPVLTVPTNTSALVTDFDSLIAELKRIRGRGYTTSDEELEAGVVAASAPIMDFTGRVVAAINVSAPKVRIGNRLEALGQYVARAATDLSTMLGATND